MPVFATIARLAKSSLFLSDYGWENLFCAMICKYATGSDRGKKHSKSFLNITGPGAS